MHNLSQNDDWHKNRFDSRNLILKCQPEFHPTLQPAERAKQAISILNSGNDITDQWNMIQNVKKLNGRDHILILKVKRQKVAQFLHFVFKTKRKETFFSIHRKLSVSCRIQRHCLGVLSLILNREESKKACCSRLSLRPTIYINVTEEDGTKTRKKYTYLEAMTRFAHKIPIDEKEYSIHYLLVI